MQDYLYLDVNPLKLKLLIDFVRTTWHLLIGDKTSFSLESRIFHAIMIFGIFTAFINALFLFFIGLGQFGLLMILFCGILWFIYHLARYKNKLTTSVILFALTANGMCCSTYFSGEASKGVNLVLFVLIIFILTIVTSRKQFLIWVPINLLLMIGLLLAEYFYPQLIKPLYQDKKGRLLDIGQTMIEVIALISLITRYIKTNYQTEKKLAENRHLQLEEINETKNKLFSIIAHDLRAPLAAVENYLELLNELTLSPQEKTIIEKNLLSSTKQTSEMLQNILSWSKDQMNGTIVNLKLISVDRSLENTIYVQRNIAKDKGIKLSYIPDPELQVMADPDMLQLVVRNLLNNAIKFTPAKGTINLSIQKKEGQCLIIVQDNGIGITKDEAPFIFSLNSKGTYGTNNEKGVGLGLMLSKNYVELQNGKIWFESIPGNGSTFYVSLSL